MLKLLSLLKDKIWIVAIILTAATLFGTFYAGKKYERQIWEVKVAKANAEIERLKSDAAMITEKVVVEYRDKIKYITKTEKVNVPVYITKESDEKCVVPKGVITLLNSVAQNVPAPPPDNKDSEDSQKKISQLTESVRENYIMYNKIREQLHSLQQWIREQEKLWESK